MFFSLFVIGGITDSQFLAELLDGTAPAVLASASADLACIWGY
jgi:hypothetical protein